jgi:hypothetical protein
MKLNKKTLATTPPFSAFSVFHFFVRLNRPSREGFHLSYKLVSVIFTSVKCTCKLQVGFVVIVGEPVPPDVEGGPVAEVEQDEEQRKDDKKNLEKSFFSKTNLKKHVLVLPRIKHFFVWHLNEDLVCTKSSMYIPKLHGTFWPHNRGGG